VKKGYRELLDEANAEIEVVSPEEAAGLLDDEETIFVDLRDPREVERDGKIPGAKHVTRGMLEFWIDPESPQAVLRLGKKLRLLLRRRLAFGACHKDGTGYGAVAGETHSRRLYRLESGRTTGRARREKEAKFLKRVALKRIQATRFKCLF
jgi:rhodanese-related sulfurtransferase